MIVLLCHFQSSNVKKIRRKMTTNDVNFTVLESKNYRESEGMGITSSGYGYMIFNRFAEAARSDMTVK